jgi:hypothetical protein
VCGRYFRQFDKQWIAVVLHLGKPTEGFQLPSAITPSPHDY